MSKIHGPTHCCYHSLLRIHRLWRKFEIMFAPGVLTINGGVIHIRHIEDYNAMLSLLSVSTISQWRLMIDCSFLLVMRSVNAETRWRHVLSNSSPQLRRGWYLQMMASVTQADLVQTRETICWLTKHGGDMLAEERRKCGHLSASSVDRYMCLPASVGCRRALLLYRAHTLLLSYVIECNDLLRLKRFLASFVSWTTDMGVERMRLLF